jgi:hypothetical protein
MKILNFRRRVAAALVACGIFVPTTVVAGDLRTNLVVNPSFEEVDPADVGFFDSVRILDWPESPDDGDPVDDGFAYNYGQNYSGIPTPPGAGDFHFTGGANTVGGQPTLTQEIDVSEGATGDLIATGNAVYDLRGFFSTYRTQFESGSVRIQFLDGARVALGSDEIGGATFLAGLPIVNDQVFWGQDAVSGTLPAGTDFVVLDIVPNGAAGAYDAYVDLVDFRVGGLPDDLALQLSVNTSTGRTQIKNLTGTIVDLDYYEITSAGGALQSDSWNSLQDQDFEGSGGTSGTGDGWEEAGGSGSSVISESYLQGSSIFAVGETINLGTAFDATGEQDLIFRYGLANGLLLHGIVDFTTGGGVVDVDFNDDGNIDTADIDGLVAEIIEGTNNPGFDLNGDAAVNSNDLEQWRNDAAAANGFVEAYLPGDANLDGSVSASDLNALGISWLQSPNTWSAGDFTADGVANAADLNDLGLNWLKTIATAAATQTVPEPSSAVLIGIGILGMILVQRK